MRKEIYEISECFNADGTNTQDELKTAHKRLFRAFCEVLEDVNEHDDALFKSITDKISGMQRFNNYLTEDEATNILNNFVNEDGSHGAIWKAGEFFSDLSDMGMSLEEEPYFNKWALYVTANKFASDQNSVIEKWVGNDDEKYLCACYDLAVTQLKDKDKPEWVRWYFLKKK